MKIEHFRKLKDNRYEIYFDDESKLILYDDIIVKYSLIAKKSIVKSDMDRIIEENDKLDSYYMAIKYINRKLRSEKEIRFYLEKKEFSPENINATITKLRDLGYLDSHIYIKAFINDQIHFTNNGFYKILKELVSKGFEEVDILIYLNEIDNEVWYGKLDKLVAKKVKFNRKHSERRLLEKLEYDLLNLGYKKDMIDEVLNEINIEDNALIEKEFLKLRNKLIKKYDERMLKSQIKNRLLMKGFSIDDVGHIIDKYY